MTVEADFLALLTGTPAVAALVGTRVALNAVPEKSNAYPLIIFSADHAPETDLTGAIVADRCQITVQCWADTAKQAAQVAAAVTVALQAAAVNGARVLSRTTTYDEETELDGAVLAVDWWDIPTP